MPAPTFLATPIMNETRNHKWLIKARPSGKVSESDFLFVDAPVPEPEDGEFLVKVMYLSATPVLRRHLRAVDSGLGRVNTGDVMPGRGVGKVIQSRHKGFVAGDIVQGRFGWQEYVISSASEADMIHIVKQRRVPFSTGLGLLGLNGFTAYLGMADVGQPKPGDTVVVSGGAGGVGSKAGQIARLLGAGRVVGIAGSPRKCRIMVEDYGYDAAINYRQEDVSATLSQVCPNGIDVFFDNVGGTILDAALEHIAKRGRIVCCGRITDKTEKELEEQRIKNYWRLGKQQARMEGCYIYDRLEDFPRAEDQLSKWLSEGKLVHEEDRLEGIDKMPEALLRVFEGQGDGKVVVRIDPEAN